LVAEETVVPETCVVHEQVHGHPEPFHFGEDRFRRALRTQILRKDGDGDIELSAQRLRRLLEAIAIARHQHEVAPVACDYSRQLVTEPGRTPGDERGFGIHRVHNSSKPGGKLTSITRLP
jgi:hypothetical protein